MRPARFGTIAFLLLLLHTFSIADENMAWTALFNGKDLSGWETSLGVPPGEKEPLGRNNDPRKVFQVVQLDGEPAIRISGELLGGLTTLREYGDYHLQLEFKWGERRFPPRANEPRDSGVFYHCAGDYHPSTGWLESLQLGILEGGETGDLWCVPGLKGSRIVVDVEGVEIPKEKRRYAEQPIRYQRGGKRFIGHAEAVLNGQDNEKPRGQWNQIELVCLGRTSIHVVNGKVNLVLTNARRKLDGREEPLTRGRLQLQSEGAEIFFRRLRLRPIKEIPADIARALR